jgi:hypothetical protein
LLIFCMIYLLKKSCFFRSCVHHFWIFLVDQVEKLLAGWSTLFSASCAVLWRDFPRRDGIERYGELFAILNRRYSTQTK